MESFLRPNQLHLYLFIKHWNSGFCGIIFASKFFNHNRMECNESFVTIECKPSVAHYIHWNVGGSTFRQSHFGSKLLGCFDVRIGFYGQYDIAFDRLTECIGGFHGGHHMGSIVGHIRWQWDVHRESGQNILVHCEWFGFLFSIDLNFNLPFSQRSIGRQRQWSTEHTRVKRLVFPLFD